MIEPITADQMQADYLLALYRLGMVKINNGEDTSPGVLVRRFAAAQGVSVSELAGPRRTQPLVGMRQECMAMLRQETNLSLSSIGRMFNRDHTTVINSIRRSNARKETET